MILLAVETSTMLGGVSIMRDGGHLIAETRLNVRTAHSERLMAEIDHALEVADLSLDDVDVLAVASGPGSFTGLRIGLGTVKGLAFGTGKPVVAVPTLEAFAWVLPFSEWPVCPMFDARKNEVYAAVFTRDGAGMKRLLPETSIRASELVKRLPESEKYIFAGDGSVLYSRELTRLLGDKAIFAPGHLSVPSPSSVAHLGLIKAEKGEFSDPASLVPFYIRKSEAETKIS